MYRSGPDKLRQIDKQIVQLYNLAEQNGEISLDEYKKRMNLLSRRVNFDNKKVYKFQCCRCNQE